MPIVYVDPIDDSTEQLRRVMHYYGSAEAPRDVKQLRASNMEMMRAMGSPVVVKHKYNAEDVENGIAVASPNRSTTFKQTRRNDPVSHGVGFVSVETSPTEWLAPDASEVVRADDSPGPGWTNAPRYRGYGPGYLVYLIEPDRAEDLFKLGETGAIIKVQNALAQAPWYPEINDNDLVINVQLGRNHEVVGTYERYEAKQTSPVTTRGYDRRGSREYTEDGGNRFVIGQKFEMALVPRTPNEEVYKVEVDR